MDAMMTRRGSGQRRWGCWVPLAAVGLIAALLAAVATLPWWGRAAAQRMLDGYLIAVGLHPAEAVIGDWTWHRITLHPLDLGGNFWRLSSGEAGLAYSPWGLLWERRADQVWVDGLELDLDLESLLADRGTVAEPAPFMIPQFPFQYARLGRSRLNLSMGGDTEGWMLEGWWGQPGIFTLSGHGPFAWVLEGRSDAGFNSGELELEVSGLHLDYLHGLLQRMLPGSVPPSLHAAGSVPTLRGGAEWVDHGLRAWGGLGELKALSLAARGFDVTAADVQIGMQGRRSQPESIELNWRGLELKHAGIAAKISAGAFGGVIANTLLGRAAGMSIEAGEGVVLGPWKALLPGFDISVSNPHGSLLKAGPEAFAFALTLVPDAARFEHTDSTMEATLGLEAHIQSGADGVSVDTAAWGDTFALVHPLWHVGVEHFDARLKMADALRLGSGRISATLENLAVKGAVQWLPGGATVKRMQGAVDYDGKDLNAVRMEMEAVVADTAFAKAEVGRAAFTLADAASWQAHVSAVRLSRMEAPLLGRGEVRMDRAALHLDTSGAAASGSVKATVTWADAAAVAALFPAAELRFHLTGRMDSIIHREGFDAGVGGADLAVTHGHGHWREVRLHALDGTLTADWNPPSGGPFDASGRLQLRNLDIAWEEGSGELSGIAADIRLTHLLPATSDGLQPFSFSRLRQGEVLFLNGDGEIRVDGGPRGLSGMARVRADGFGGQASIEFDFFPGKESTEADIRVMLHNVELKQLAALFPAFDGSISGRVSGHLAFAWREGRLILQPGELALPTGETGSFSFRRTGWLSGDTTLNLDALEKNREVHQIIQMSAGAGIITEMAMRNLTMEAFRLRIQPGDRDKPVLMELKGFGEVRNTRVPVVLTVPVGGDLLETLELVLQLRDRLSAPQ